MFKLLRRVNSESSSSSSSTKSTDSQKEVAPLGNGTRNSVEPARLLTSASPLSELPKTLAAYNYAYQTGKMDFDDPPEPPQGLDLDSLAAKSGQFLAPRPFSEGARQRAVANLSIFKGYSTPAKARRQYDAPLPPLPTEVDSAPSSTNTTPRLVSSPSFSDTTLLANNMAVLELLSAEAKQRFGTEVSRVSIMDRGTQRFIAGQEGDQELPRDSTACSHAILQASVAADQGKKTDGMVILDFDKDWRFKSNNFGEQKFYASAPIYSKPALGDGENLQPIGLFCLLDPKPRTEFTQDDRKALVAIADKAGEEIARLEGIKQEVELERLRAERESWRNTTKERRARIARSLPILEEAEKPDDFDVYVEQQSTSAPSNDSAFDRVAYTTVPPLFAKRYSRQGAVNGIPRRSLPSTDPSKVASIEESNAIIDLATRLVSETLEFDIVVLLSIDTRRKDPSGYPPLRIISSWNYPIPPPLFDIVQHLSLLPDDAKANTSLLFVDPDFTNGGEATPTYSTGVITRVSHSKKGPNGESGVLHLLAGFSEERDKIIKRQDVAWMLGFAHDLQKYV